MAPIDQGEQVVCGCRRESAHPWRNAALGFRLRARGGGALPATDPHPNPSPIAMGEGHSPPKRAASRRYLPLAVRTGRRKLVPVAAAKIAPLPSHWERGWGEGRSVRTGRRSGARLPHSCSHSGAFWRLRLVLSIVILILVNWSPLMAVARQGTPAAEPSGTAAPDCRARPVSPAELVAILRQPVPEDPDAENPRGDAVPPAERAAVGELVGDWASCLASGNVPGMLGLFTPDGIRRLLGERAPVVGGPSGVRIAVLNVANVERLRDGRIAAWVDIDPSGAGTAPPERLILIRRAGGRGRRVAHRPSARARGTGRRGGRRQCRPVRRRTPTPAPAHRARILGADPGSRADRADARG